MHFARSGKERVARTELNALAFDRKPTASGSDDIEFVARVWLLQVSSLGRVNLDCQGAMA